MPLYQYRAKDWQGHTHQGTIRHANHQAAADELRDKNLVILSIREFRGLKTKRVPWSELFSINPQLKKPRARDYMFLCRQFSTMIDAGITVLDTVRLLSQQSEHIKLRERLYELGLQLEQGQSLYKSFAAHSDFFPPLMISMIEAGEMGGVLGSVMDQLALHYQKQHDLEEKIRSATTYPLIILGVAAAVILLLIFFVLPTFANIFSTMGLRLPWFTSLLMAAGAIAATYWYVLIAFCCGTWLFIRRYIATEEGRKYFDLLKLRIPIYGSVYHKNLMARFSRNLGLLLASGVELITALELIERIVNNTITTQALESSREAVHRGEPLADSLEESKIFPAMIVEMIRIGEKTGSLDDMLNHSANFYENEVTYVVERLNYILEPTLLIGLGLIVGIIVISIITPMFEIYQML